MQVLVRIWRFAKLLPLEHFSNEPVLPFNYSLNSDTLSNIHFEN